MNYGRHIGAIAGGAFASSFVAGNELGAGRVLEQADKRATDYLAIAQAQRHAMAIENGVHGAPGPETGVVVPHATPRQLDALHEAWVSLGDRVRARLEQESRDEELELFNADRFRYVESVAALKQRIGVRDADVSVAMQAGAEQNGITPQQFAESLAREFPFDQLLLRRVAIGIGPNIGLNGAQVETVERFLRVGTRFAIAMNAAEFAASLQGADFAFFAAQARAEFNNLPATLGQWLSIGAASVSEAAAHGLGGFVLGLLKSPLGAAVAVTGVALAVRGGAKRLKG